MPEQHSLLGPSSAERWMVCPGSICLGKKFEDKTSAYAEEGTLAHAIGELRARDKFLGDLEPGEYEEKLAKLEAHKLYTPEMMECTDTYLALIEEVLAEHVSPVLCLEVQLNYEQYVNDGFGTGDCVIISGSRIDVIDYKHGKGKHVEVVQNPQLKIYGLAAYLQVFKDTPQGITIGTHICQPRNGGNTSKLYTDAEIISWAEETLRPAAKRAEECFNIEPELLPEDTLCAGEHCRFCKAKAVCKARGKAVAVEIFGKKDANTYTLEELAAILARGKAYVDWVNDVQEYCLEQVKLGKPIPGYTLVNGKSSRKFKDPDIAIAALAMLGYNPEQFYTRKPMSVAQAEKVVGKKTFGALEGVLYETIPGAPTLAPESDKRQAITGAEIFK